MSLLGYQVTDVTTAEPRFASSLSPPSIQTTMPTTDSQALGDEYTLFPVEDIVQYPLPGYVAPASVQFSPDDKLITYLYSPDSTLSRKIYAFDVAARQQRLLVSPPGGGVDEGNLSTVEKLRRERLRERGLGVTRYEWGKGVPHRLMVPLPSGIYVQEGVRAELQRRVASTSWSPILDPQLSPDACSIAYVRDDEIFVVPVAFGDPIQITSGARGTGKTHGLAEYIAQEEMDRRNGFWWSPDSRYIAFAEVDSTRIPPFRIMHQGKASTGGEAEEIHAYPFAGHSNVSVRLGVVPSNGGSVVWMDLEVGLCGEGRDDEEYLARVTWLPNGSLTAQVQNRTQTKLKLLKFDPLTGKRTVLFTEESDVWVNLHDCFTSLRKCHGLLSGGFIWASEKTGFRHLYVHDEFGNCIRALTQGSWMVEQVAGVDEEAGLVYFTGTHDSPLEMHLYSVSLDCTQPNLVEPKRLTQGAGRHIVVLDHQMKMFVDIHDSLDTPPRLLLRSLDTGKLLVTIYEQPAPTYHTRRLQLTPPEFKSLTASDGTVLHGLVYIPDSKQFGRPPYRTVVSVYGGPNVQVVCNSWMNTVDMRAQYLRSRGILVWKLDNRGSARRGLDFEGAIKHNMGKIDVEDQQTGVQWLVSQGLAMSNRIGIYGWSYGGYMASMALARCPQTFSCAVAGAPVTSWDGYDTHYTEKYMGTPASNPAGYQYSSVMHHVYQITGKLLLVHGMIDENVHFRHTARLINSLTAASKDYELLVFPDERHMPRGLRDRMYMEERICDFLERNI
ncbi:uncharacterized protein [Physcomitrium patens]|uniref:Uncharacterized protein n=1 Tax=Physcomitrium patens TaxID=3218 RepID=A0A2K1KWL5_PHYPA|nr:uncharacterized protein LOC112279589 isoform X2 [Physcomitrium patens]PNR58182.1 hypothetical protein PHYPA_005177 [Physcomitrium patens]|eukprot:XP_024369963.1 uncharacterized protein LOC112279589 isoform X2 [Physcomitrella patens]